MNTFLGKLVLVYLAGILSEETSRSSYEKRYESLTWISRHSGTAYRKFVLQPNLFNALDKTTLNNKTYFKVKDVNELFIKNDDFWRGH